MAPTLYYAEPSAPARSVLLVGRALGIKFNLKPVNLFAGEQLQPQFLKINPQHTIPTLIDDDGFVVWDSNVINTYLAEKYGKDDSLYPKDLKKRTLVNQRLHFNNGTLFPRFINTCGPILFGKINEVPKEAADSLKEAYGFIETFLTGNDYVAGNQLTIADLNIASILTNAEAAVPVFTPDFPQISAWFKKIQALPYFNEVNENGRKQFGDLIKSKLA